MCRSWKHSRPSVVASGSPAPISSACAHSSFYREIPGLSETWFAFHPLFREILGDELARTTEADSVAALHWQIATWFAGRLVAGRGASLRRGRRHPGRGHAHRVAIERGVRA